MLIQVDCLPAMTSSPSTGDTAGSNTSTSDSLQTLLPSIDVLEEHNSRHLPSASISPVITHSRSNTAVLAGFESTSLLGPATSPLILKKDKLRAATVHPYAHPHLLSTPVGHMLLNTKVKISWL